MESWKLSYNKRCVDFFLSSIQELKKQSGGQRWNEICEDTVELFFRKFPESLGENPFTREQLWHFLFESPDKTSYELFSNLSKHDEFLDFFFLILQALLDPPAEWWRSK
jgi:hypothetical protein